MTELNKFQKEIESLLTKADKATDRRLYGLYIDTIKDLKKSLLVDYQRLDALTSSQRLKLSQMSTLLEQLDQSADKLKKGLKSEITGHLIDAGKIAYNELFYEFENSRAGINFAMLKEDELKTIIETPVANFKLSERLDDGVVERLKNNIKDDLNRIFLHGASYAQASARLAEQGYSSYRRAMMITRTEAGRVQAVSRQKSQMEAESLGIEFDKMWVATLDGRTRHNHAELDGVRVKPDDYFEINGLKAKQPHMFGFASEDVNCRCRTISRLKGDDTPLLRRDSETGEVVEYRNYREWEKAKINKVTIEKVSDEVYNYIEGKDNIRKAIEDFGHISDEQANLIYSRIRGDGLGYIETSNAFDINRALRPGGDMDSLTDDDWDVMSALSEVIESNTTPYNIRGLRKVHYDWATSFISDTDLPSNFDNFNDLSDALNTIKGHTFMEHAFSSISSDPELNVFPNRRIWLDIEVPKGTNAYMTSNEKESEFILGTGTIFELKESSVVKDDIGDLLKITLRVKEK